MATEKRLIDANDAEQFAREHILDAKERYTILAFLRECSTVDAVEVVHGRWEKITGGMIILGDCSKCKVRQPVIGTNYCKNCGAKMDGGDEDG